jgi:hypothetical protein
LFPPFSELEFGAFFLLWCLIFSIIFNIFAITYFLILQLIQSSESDIFFLIFYSCYYFFGEIIPLMTRTYQQCLNEKKTDFDPLLFYLNLRRYHEARVPTVPTQ